jgi:PST family polysaccharide transporter
VAGDHCTVNRLVNEQTEISLLLAVPGILATLTFAPWVIRTFYSGSFEPAVVVLQWQVLGVLGRVLSWPMGYILLAKGERKLFIISETFAHTLHIGLVWMLISRFGVASAGMAFAGLYVAYTAAVFIISHRLTGFRWSGANLRFLSWMLPVVLVVFAGMQGLPALWSFPLGLLASLLLGWVCLKGLVRRMPAHQLGRLRVLTRWV